MLTNSVSSVHKKHIFIFNYYYYFKDNVKDKHIGLHSLSPKGFYFHPATTCLNKGVVDISSGVYYNLCVLQCHLFTLPLSIILLSE